MRSHGDSFKRRGRPWWRRRLRRQSARQSGDIKTKLTNKQTNKQTKNKQCSACGIGQRRRIQRGWTPSPLRSRGSRWDRRWEKSASKFNKLIPTRRRLERGTRSWPKGTWSGRRRTSRGSWRSRGRSSCWAGGSREPRRRSTETHPDEGRESRSTTTRTQVRNGKTCFSHLKHIANVIGQSGRLALRDRGSNLSTVQFLNRTNGKQT